MNYADLHIHIGRSLDGKAVKITASPNLTLPEVIRVSRDIKGLHMIGIVDSHTRGVIRDYNELIAQGFLHAISGGGYQSGNLVIIPGIEAELQVGHGHAHFLVYFPTITVLQEFAACFLSRVSNWQLSSQKIHMDVSEWLKTAEAYGGLWLPAHAFTPHKGLYGACCSRIPDVLSVFPAALEMGLSADRRMAQGISELDDVVLFSNSDAHSLPNIAREYNEMHLSDLSFNGLEAIIKKKSGQLYRNFGLHPRIGKYHRTFCLDCSQVVSGEAPMLICPVCHSHHVVPGVLDRLAHIADREITTYQSDPNYVYRVPLAYLPGIGSKTYQRLLNKFGTELTVYHEAEFDDLSSVVGDKTARIIMQAKVGTLKFTTGGGGFFGRVTT
ncbi:endonuclease Q family protein [Dehalobacter sp. DCM]|uniref:endonuclease Q family protein n=1 Tax=Dehalobacter sp. DCM TaxID=2907827 RepID=UPI003081E01F|nr:endonuclease Q family protein [Dehalobacter sp. DCM]